MYNDKGKKADIYVQLPNVAIVYYCIHIHKTVYETLTHNTDN